MVLDRIQFSYKNKILIEKVIIAPPYRYKAIFQNEGCFIFVKGGGSNVLSATEQMRLNTQQGILLKCGTYFVDWLEQATGNTLEVIAIHLYPDLLRELYASQVPKSLLPEEGNHSLKRIVPESTLSKFIDSINFYFQNPSLVTDDLLELKIKELILLLVQTKNATSVRQLFYDLFSPRTHSIKNTVSAHLYTQISVSDLAELCHMSLSTFKREFKNIYATSPLHYINSQRIKKAKDLLTSSPKSIAEIAFQVGYNDPHYFTRLFKKQEGISPSAFREANKK